MVVMLFEFFTVCLLQFIGATESQIDNQHDVSCNWPFNYIKCAYDNKGKCEIIDKDIFSSELPCRYAERNCDNYCAKYTDLVKVTNGYGECVCPCIKYNAWGNKCQYVVPLSRHEPYPSGIQLITPIHVEFNKPAPLLVTFSFGPEPVVVVQDLIGGYVVRMQDTSTLWSRESYFGCVNFVSTLKYLEKDVCGFIDERNTQSNNMFFDNFVIPWDWTEQPGETKSFIRRIHLTAYHPLYLTKLSEHEHRYHLSVPAHHFLIPIIRFTGCGRNLASVKKYEYGDEIHLTAEILYLKDGYPFTSFLIRLPEDQKLQYSWKAYRLEGDTSKNPMMNDFHIGPLSWDLPPFHWLGLYVINLTATGNLISSEYKNSTFNICVVEVVSSFLVAVIRGGSSRFVYKEYGFTLDASKSRDPNSPDGKSIMLFTFTCNWTQEAVCEPHTTDSLSREPIKIGKMELNSQKVYNFTLKVTIKETEAKAKSQGFASQIVVVGELGRSKTLLEYIGIDCVYNCKMKTNIKDILYLKVEGSWALLGSLEFEWIIYELDGNGKRKDNGTSVDHIRQSESTPSFILIIKEASLNEKAKYDIKVILKKSPLFAVYSIITTSSTPLPFKIDPEKGIAGVTKFNLSCEPSEQSPYKVFEFYDKYKIAAGLKFNYSDRMIISQESCYIEELVLTRGPILEVLSYDEYGTAMLTVLVVELSKGNQTTADIEETLYKLMRLSDKLSIGELLKRASTIPDLLTSAKQDEGISRADILETLVVFLSGLTITRYDHLKMGISLWHSVLLAARETLSFESTWRVARAIHSIALALAVRLKEAYHCTFSILYQIVSRILDCLSIIIELKDKHSGNNTLPLKYINTVMYSMVKGISHNVITSVLLLESALSLRHLPAQNHKLIESPLGVLSMWVKVDTLTALSNYTLEEYRTNMSHVFFSNYLEEEVKDLDPILALQFVSFRQEPTWVARTNTVNRFEVSVCIKGTDDETCKYLKKLNYVIKVAFDISNLVSNVNFTNITIRRLEHNLDFDHLDMELPVYKLDPLPLANVEALFRLHGDDTELLVLVKKDIRPTYDEVMSNGIKVSTSSPLYSLVTESLEEKHLYYLAIQPKSNGTVSFDLKIYSKMCYTWHNRWEAKGCWSKTDPGTRSLICECNRLSLIGGLVEKIPFPLEVVGDFPLYLTIGSAEMIRVLSLPLLLLTFLLLVIICVKADRYDRAKRFVSILPDNFPGDKFGFLVCVATGARVGAGTDAAVGIKVYGSKNDGREHILICKTHDAMEGMGEDWFLIYETETLGKISCLELWHDNAGAKADWYCESIIIYDLNHKDCYFFIVNDWVTLSFKRFPQVDVFPTPFSEITSSSRVFLDYFKSGFRLSHLWFDTVARHPRDPVSRVDRLAIILCFVLVSMAVSISIITLPYNNVEDDFSYSMTWLMVEISVYSCIPAAVLACMLMHMFRKIYKIIFYTEKEEEETTHERKVTRVSWRKDYLSTPSTTSLRDDDRSHIHYGRRHTLLHTEEQSRTLGETINLTLMPKPLVPVQLEGDEPNVIIEKVWLFATWFAVIVIALVCMILILYLSQNLPPVKTNKWFTVVALSVFIHAFVLLPLKIVLVSSLLAVAFKRIIYKDVYTFDPSDGRQIELFGNVRYLADLVHLRAQPMYQPLHEVFRERHRQQMLRAARWSRLYELIVQIMFLVVLGTLLRAHIPTQHQTNAHLRTLVKDVYEVFNTTEYLNYLQYQCEQHFFKFIWYDLKPLSQGSELNFFRKDWMYDNVNRMIGKVRLRQFRVNPGYCNVSVKLPINCSAPFSVWAKDTGDYNPFWLRKDGSFKKDEIIGFQFLSDRSYTWSRDDSSFSYDGKTGQSYPSGGYTWVIGASDDELGASLFKLREEGWIGHYTRAVLAQVKLYNVNTRLFSEMALVSEQTIAGEILSTIVVQSVDINLQMDWWLAIFVFFAFMLCVRIYLLTNFVGVMGLFENWRRPYELLMTVNAVAVLLYLSLHYLTVPRYVTEYQEHAEELMFFDFYKIAHYSFTARALLCALYILNVIRFYSLWRFGKTVFRVFLTIVLSMKYVIWSIGIYVLFQLLLFRAMGYLFIIFTDVVFNPNMFYRSNYSYFHVGNETNGFKILCFILCFSNVIIIMLFVIIFTQKYKTARDKYIRDRPVDNYISFVHKEVKTMLNNPVVQRMTLKRHRNYGTGGVRRYERY